LEARQKTPEKLKQLADFAERTFRYPLYSVWIVDRKVLRINQGSRGRCGFFAAVYLQDDNHHTAELMTEDVKVKNGKRVKLRSHLSFEDCMSQLGRLGAVA
jgi:hypothetical protein